MAISVTDGDLLARIRSAITGVYELLEWRLRSITLRAPQVAGRFIVLNGSITTILHNRSEPTKPMTATMIGDYSLNTHNFAYGYDDVSTVTEGPAGATVSHELPWQGRRSYNVRLADEELRLRAVDGPHEFVFTAAGLRYSEDGTPLRTWRRIVAQ
jgi:hypothetical protein